jgi:hypothetical protein
MVINGRRYTRERVVFSTYYRASGYILLTFDDGATARVDANVYSDRNVSI